MRKNLRPDAGSRLWETALGKPSRVGRQKHFGNTLSAPVNPVVGSVPPITNLMALTVSSGLGHNDVTTLIGENGMGEVYRARHAKLDRDDAQRSVGI